MASNTKNVKLGVCKVSFGGYDLGYTKGGVEVSVKTDTHKVNVDQFGKTPINEYIMGREVHVKVPMAETTLENLVQVMPGAVLTTDAVKASITSGAITGQFAANDTLIIGGVVFTWKVVAVTPLDIAIGLTLAASLANLATEVSNYAGLAITATATATTFTLTSDNTGVAGNLIAVTKTGVGATFTLGATLAGGTDAVVSNVIVPTAIGVSLLNIAQRLVLHPIANAATDFSEDFIVFLAATSGALTYAYKLEDERVFNVEFAGFPDPTTSRLFAIGNIGAL
jgi:hypothetical protein